MSSIFDLSGRHALVTGASRGIGLAIAQGLAQHGASIVITGRKADTLAAAAEQLQAAGATVQSIVCHQGDPAAIASLFEQLDRLGHAVEIAVVNAATNPVMGPLLQTDLAAWQKIMDVNLTGSLVTAQQAARLRL
jgi:NAD(P)-dependent dehydrogenase (short-subunit alcohol dehydrogenase family)